MIKDIDISHYYKKFIETSNDDMAKYNKELEVINKMKADCRSYIKSKNQVIKDDLKINLNEYGFQFLNDNIELINKLEQLINNRLSYTVGERRIVLLQLLRYCNLAKKANDYIIALKLATRRSELSLTDYKKYIHRYYSYGVKYLELMVVSIDVMILSLLHPLRGVKRRTKVRSVLLIKTILVCPMIVVLMVLELEKLLILVK
jgi:hypothetical protein